MVEAAAQQVYSFAEFEVDAKKRLLLKNAQTISLNSKAFDLLLVLIENRGQIMTKEELLETVWVNQFVEENNLTVHISALRKIFGEKKGEHQFIVTIPGKGYKFVADVRLPFESSEQEKPKSLSVLQNSLTVYAPPRFETNLIGRTREIAEIKDLLRQNDVNLLTLTGAGGSGKTSLARSVGEELKADFADGVFFVELAAATETDFVVSAIAQILNITEASNKSLVETLRDFLQTRKILLILDNFEQVLSAAPIVGEFSDASDSLKILVTSRAVLRLPNEREFSVLPLALPPLDSQFSTENLDEYPATALFCKRAQSVKPSFVLTNENIAAVAEICRRLDGLPLAIELAAVRIKLLSPSAILERLENSLNLLTGGAKDSPSRQRTMRGAIEWSYDLLTEDEKFLFRRLAVFAGGFTVEAAEFVVELEKRISVLDLLDSLIENNLLVSKDQTDGNARLRMLEVVREFALECLETSGEAESVRRLHSKFFLKLAEKAEPLLHSESGNEWLEKLETEYGNLRAALSWSLKNNGEIAARIAVALRFFWLNRSYLSEGLNWSNAALQTTENTISEVRRRLLLSNGVFLKGNGNLEASRKFYEKALAESQAANDLHILIIAQHGLAAITVLQKDFSAAQHFNEAALAHSRQLKDETQTAYSLCSLGDLEMSKGNFLAARPLLEECLTLSKNLGNKRLLTVTYFNLGTIDYFDNSFEAAAFNFAESLQIAEEMGNTTMISCALEGFAALAVTSGNPEQSAKLAGAAESLRESIGYYSEPAEEIFRNNYLAETRAALGEKQFAALYADGLAMNSNEAVALASNQNLPEKIDFDANENDYSNEIVIENHKIERIIVEESEPEIKRLPVEQNNSRRFSIFALAAFVAVAAIGAGFWLFTKKAVPVESIAVMPFVYENGSAENEYLSDGMTESLINNLSQIPNLTVKARASVFYYKGKEIAPLRVGSELNVQAVLLGRITERGESLNISLELVDAKTNNHLWGEQYTRKKSDLAVLQNDIARDVSAKLRQKLAGGESVAKGGTANAEAYQLYLKGRYLWNKRTYENHLKAISAFEQAISLDPNFALAYAGLGDVYTVDSYKGDSAERNSKARAAALKALETTPDSAEAHTVLAKVEWNEFRRAEAEKHFLRALEINPNYASARQWYAEFLLQQVRTEEAIAEINRAIELDPLSSIINSDAVYIYTMARQYDRAIAQAGKLIEFDPNWRRAYFWRAAAYESKGDYQKAIADFEKDNELSDKHLDEKERQRSQWKLVKEALEKSGERGYWEKTVELIKNEPEPDQYFLALCYAKLGDKEKALSSLERAFEAKNDQINLMKAEPYLDNLQSEPRFQTLLQRIGLMP